MKDKLCGISKCPSNAVNQGLCLFHEWQKYHTAFKEGLRKRNKERTKRIEDQKRGWAIKKKEIYDRSIQAQKERSRRKDDMFLMYKEGSTLEQIGSKYKITRERVRQVIREFPDYYKYNKCREGKPNELVTCKMCGRLFSVSYGLRLIKKYCHNPCRFNPSKNRTADQIRELNNTRHKKYYHTVLKLRPDFKEFIRQNNRKCAQKRKQENIEYLRKHPDDETFNKMVECYKSGGNLADSGRQFGIHPSTVRAIFQARSFDYRSVRPPRFARSTGVAHYSSPVERSCKKCGKAYIVDSRHNSRNYCHNPCKYFYQPTPEENRLYRKRYHAERRERMKEDPVLREHVLSLRRKNYLKKVLKERSMKLKKRADAEVKLRQMMEKNPALATLIQKIKE